MAYCDYCHEGIGPKNNYEFIFHKRGVFGTHENCKDKMIKRLDRIEKKNSPDDYHRGSKDN